MAESDVTLTVNIPAGILGGQRIRLPQQGDRSGRGVRDALIDVFVIPDKDMGRQGDDVIGILELSLLEALQGTKKTVKTVKGLKNLKVKPGVKNKEVIRLQGFGVPPMGAHLFEVRVEYPEDTTKLIELLEEQAGSQPEPEEIEGE